VIIQVLPDMLRLADEIDTTNESTNLMALNGVIAFISATFILPVIQQPGWSQKVRALVTFVYALIVGAATTWFAGDFDVANVTESILQVFVIAIATYHGFSGPTKIAGSIENATSSSGRKQPLDDPPA
jgi:hypothetical protein